jgi:hypothetical protein
MTTDQMAMKLREIMGKRMRVMERMVEPSRAACNAMLDAGMTRTAEPLKELLFEWDAINGEAVDVARDNPEQLADALLLLLTGERPPR